MTAPTPTWEGTPVRPAGTTPINALAIAPSNSDIIWIAENNSTVARTMNGTALSPSWTAIHQSGVSGELPNRLPTSIVIDPDDPDLVYITYGGYVYDNIWRTTNGTAATPLFQAITSISSFGWPPSPVRALARHPRNRNVLYVGTEVGMYESADGGNTWSTSQDGPNDAPVYDLSFLRGTDLLLASTYGRGLWTSDTASAVSTFAPTNVVATANGISSVSVSWTAYPGATSYQLLRKAGGATQWTVIPIGNTASYTDNSVSAGLTYLYRVRAVLGSTLTGASNVDLATTTTFTLDGLLLGTRIRAQHLSEVREAVNMVLTAAGLPILTFAQTPTADVTPIRATDITALRTGLTRAYRNIGLPDPVFAQAITPGVTVKATHFQELRDRVK